MDFVVIAYSITTKKNFANGSSFPIAIFLLTKVTISHNLEASIQTKTEAQ